LIRSYLKGKVKMTVNLNDKKPIVDWCALYPKTTSGMIVGDFDKVGYNFWNERISKKEFFECILIARNSIPDDCWKVW